jgi:GNAT superfamily N-acetyltransferase
VVDLSLAEDWLIMEMEYKEMIVFKCQSSELKEGFQITKVEADINEYAQATRDLIYELAVYEKLAHQCEVTADELIRDYKRDSRYYELAVLTKNDVPVGVAIWFLRYDLNKGVGFWLEDIYVKEEFRGNGLGTCLWQFAIEDAVTNHSSVKYMNWTVLGWNTTAIDFYYKYNAKNLTKLNGTRFFRMRKDTIYASKLAKFT